MVCDSCIGAKGDTALGEFFSKEFKSGEEAGVGRGDWGNEALGDVSWDLVMRATISKSAPFVSAADASDCWKIIKNVNSIHF